MTGASERVAVDLDAARRARAERLGALPLKVGGKTYPLRADMPISSGIAYDLGVEKSREKEPDFDFDECARDVLGPLLLNPGDLDAVMATGISWFDLSDILGSYQSLGESEASSEPSSNGGKPSRRTSKRTTASTSKKRSTAKKR